MFTLKYAVKCILVYAACRNDMPLICILKIRQRKEKEKKFSLSMALFSNVVFLR